MAIFETYSKSKNGFPDIFIYEEINNKLRNQIFHIWKKFLFQDSLNSYIDNILERIYQTICEEEGLKSLTSSRSTDDINYAYRIESYFEDLENYETTLNTIHIIFFNIEYIQKVAFNYSPNVFFYYTAEEAIQDLNIRFRENGVGYSYESGKIIKIDSTIIHNEITKPALNLLSNGKFEGANEEYLKAHEHYRHGRNKECLSECLKSFESTMKIICKEKNWSFNQTDTAKKLIQICFQNNLIPTFTQNQFTSLQNLLESGIPPIRNKLGGHGQGAIPQKVNDEMTRYGLNLTGTNIIFLVEQSEIK